MRYTALLLFLLLTGIAYATSPLPPYYPITINGLQTEEGFFIESQSDQLDWAMFKIEGINQTSSFGHVVTVYLDDTLVYNNSLMFFDTYDADTFLFSPTLDRLSVESLKSEGYPAEYMSVGQKMASLNYSEWQPSTLVIKFDGTEVARANVTFVPPRQTSNQPLPTQGLVVFSYFGGVLLFILGGILLGVLGRLLLRSRK